jgi:hypothetical protein
MDFGMIPPPAKPVFKIVPPLPDSKGRSDEERAKDQHAWQDARTAILTENRKLQLEYSRALEEWKKTVPQP